MTEKDRSQLQALYNLARHANTPRHEAESAERMLQAKCKKLGVNPETIFNNAHEETNQVSWIPFNLVKGNPAWYRFMAGIVAKYHGGIVLINQHGMLTNKQAILDMLQAILSRMADDYTAFRLILKAANKEDYSTGYAFGIMLNLTRKAAEKAEREAQEQEAKSRMALNGRDDSESLIIIETGMTIPEIIQDMKDEGTIGDNDMSMSIRDQFSYIRGLRDGQNWDKELLMQ